MFFVLESMVRVSLSLFFLLEFRFCACLRSVASVMRTKCRDDTTYRACMLIYLVCIKDADQVL